jgi:hypothetical protein
VRVRFDANEPRPKPGQVEPSECLRLSQLNVHAKEVKVRMPAFGSRSLRVTVCTCRVSIAPPSAQSFAKASSLDDDSAPARSTEHRCEVVQTQYEWQAVGW